MGITFFASVCLGVKYSNDLSRNGNHFEYVKYKVLIFSLTSE